MPSSSWNADDVFTRSNNRHDNAEANAVAITDVPVLKLEPTFPENLHGRGVAKQV
jgi:hypothetical protein